MIFFSHNSCPGVSISGQVSSRITSQQRARRHLTLPLTFNAKASPLQTDRRYNVYQHTYTLYILTIRAYRAGTCCASLYFMLFLNVSGSPQSHQGRTLAVPCRRLQRLRSPLLLLDTAAPRVGTASHEGQRHTAEEGNCVNGFAKLNKWQE